MIYVIAILLIFIVILVLKVKLNKKLLKTRKKFKFNHYKPCFFTSFKLFLNCLSPVDEKFLSLKELQFVDHILSCVKFNTPKIYGKINYDALKNYNLNLCKPILFFDKITKNEANLIKIAQKYEKFNVIIQQNDLNCDFKCIDINFCSLTLLSSIMNLNVYVKPKFKVKIMQEGLFVIDKNYIKEIKNNEFFTQNYKLFIEKYKNNGIFYDFDIKTIKNTNFKLIYCFKLKIGQFINKLSKGIEICNICDQTKTYMLFNTKIDIKQYYNYVILSKNIKNNDLKFIFYYGNNAKIDFVTSKQDYINKLNEIKNVKVECDNKSLQILFNMYLPNIIKFDDINLKIINFASFFDAYNNFKQKSITAIQFYLWIKHRYFGIEIENNILKISPLIKENFEFTIKINNKLYTIPVIMGDKKYILINNVKFYNCNTIDINKLEGIDKLLFVQ